MTTIIDGKAVAQKIQDQVAAEVAAFVKKTGVKPGLATVLVGSDPASHVYVQKKIQATKKCGMESIHHQLPKDASEKKLLDLIADLNQNPQVHGILVQMPLPKPIDQNKIIQKISPQKDVDGLHPMNMGALVANQKGFRSCTPLGVMKLLEHYEINPRGKDVLIVGRSNLVGKPLALLMLHADATVMLAHSQTQNLKEKVGRADILVGAMGRPKFIEGIWIKKGAVVIDVGINRLADNSLCGDVDFASAKERARAITPVPGGVGPMTIAMLMVNTLEAAKNLC